MLLIPTFYSYSVFELCDSLSWNYYNFLVDSVEENEVFNFLEATQGISVSVVLICYSS